MVDSNDFEVPPASERIITARERIPEWLDRARKALEPDSTDNFPCCTQPTWAHVIYHELRQAFGQKSPFHYNNDRIDLPEVSRPATVVLDELIELIARQRLWREPARTRAERLAAELITAVMQAAQPVSDGSSERELIGTG